MATRHIAPESQLFACVGIRWKPDVQFSDVLSVSSMMSQFGLQDKHVQQCVSSLPLQMKETISQL